MRALSLTLLFVASPLAQAADEKTTLAVGDWSEPANGVRGRLVLARWRTLGDSKIRESLVYIELENVSDTRGVSVPFDPDALKCELTGADGKAVLATPTPGSGGRPGKTLVSLPYDSSARLRANPYGFGRADGFLVPLNNTAWHTKDGEEYVLSGTLTVAAPAGQPGAWAGELKMKVTLSPKSAGPARH